ncbi:MAG: hypothetical protein HY712_06700 [candidate division NC10 bacterium]|nr:hypothetical protein [candidate division NC10 bacterium]
MTSVKKRGVRYAIKKGQGAGGAQEVLTPPYYGDDVKPRVLRGADGIDRLEKTPHDRLSVKVTIEISGKLRRADLDRFAQSMSKTVSFEFEDGGNGV